MGCAGQTNLIHAGLPAGSDTETLVPELKKDESSLRGDGGHNVLADRCILIPAQKCTVKEEQGYQTLK